MATDAVILLVVAGLLIGLWAGFGLGHWRARNGGQMAQNIAYERGRQAGYCAAKQETLNATMLKVRLCSDELVSMIGRN